ncbi:MAG TPA: hypothetical protein VNC22_23230 [Sporichthya sp.]|nr:hypothetical protein [Sporichthya sp.]
MLHHVEDARVTSGSEVISQHARVNENGGVVKIYIPSAEPNRWIPYGWMRYKERREIGESTAFFGVPSGRNIPVTWNITPNPCRSCR